MTLDLFDSLIGKLYIKLQLISWFHWQLRVILFHHNLFLMYDKWLEDPHYMVYVTLSMWVIHFTYLKYYINNTSISCISFNLSWSSLYIVINWCFKIRNSKMPSFFIFLFLKSKEFAEFNSTMSRFNCEETILD